MLYKINFLLMVSFALLAEPTFSNSPSVLLINSTAMNVSWLPIWQHPVNMYILVVNATDQTIDYFTSDTFYIIHKNIMDKECTQLEFSVLAVTDLGRSENSIITAKGFPKGNMHA